jgi:hypothetical protein
MKADRVHEMFIYHPQEPHVLLLDSSPPICELEKGKMCEGVARAHEKLPSVTKQKATECYMTPNKKFSAVENFSTNFF